MADTKKMCVDELVVNMVLQEITKHSYEEAALIIERLQDELTIMSDAIEEKLSGCSGSSCQGF